MTTLVGIKARKNRKGVVLASDLRGTKTEWKPEGDIVYKRQTTSDFQKIYIDKAGNVAFAATGRVDYLYGQLIDSITNGKISIEEIIENGFFPELRNTNFERWGGKIPNLQDTNSILLATKYGEPKLYTCWPMGLVEERQWTTIGSGSEFADKYLSEQEGPMEKNSYTLKQSVDHAVTSLKEASQDIYTGGLDLVVVTKNGIKPFGKDIKTALESAKKDAIRDIKRKL